MSAAALCDCPTCRLASEVAALVNAHFDGPSPKGRSRVEEAIDALGMALGDIIAQAPSDEARRQVAIRAGAAMSVAVHARSAAPGGAVH